MKIDINKIKISKEKIIILALAAAVVILASFSVFVYKKAEAGVLSPQAAAQKAVDYINHNLLEGKTASLGRVTDKGQIYEFTLKIDNEEYTSYVTRDGKILFPTKGYEITTQLSQNEEIPKRDKPDIKLFVMSYCPYGLQSEKMFLPVYNLLKGQASMGIYFVDYAMHGKKEVDENLRQYCLEKEEGDKYADYLGCFTKSGDAPSCLSEAKIDIQKINQCVSETDKKYHITEDYNNKSTWISNRYPRFNVYKDLNEEYGVSGSPTLVINDTVIVSDKSQCPEGGKKCVVISGIDRSPEKFKEVVCQAFNNQPQACSQKLSDAVPSPGIGGGTGGGSGSCK